MSTNGNAEASRKTPGEGVDTVRPTALPALDKMTERAIAEEAARRSHHAWEAAASAHEWIKELAKARDVDNARAEEHRRKAEEHRKGVDASLLRLEMRLGTREGSSPALEDIGKRWAFNELADAEERRKERARIKAIAIKWVAVIGPAVGALAYAALQRACQ